MIKFSSETFTPCFSIDFISSNSAHGSTTTPFPITETLPDLTIPDGRSFNLYVIPLITSVWPAL